MSNDFPYSGTNVRSFPYKEIENKTTTTGSSTSSSTTTSSTTTTVEDCHIMLRARCEQLRQLYEDSVGRPMSGAILKQLLLSLLDGTPAEYFQYALEETAMAPMPSWRYTQAIVKRLQDQRVDPQRVRESQQPKRQQGRRILAEQDYTQREYRHDESRVDAMMAEFLQRERS